MASSGGIVALKNLEYAMPAGAYTRISCGGAYIRISSGGAYIKISSGGAYTSRNSDSANRT